MTQANETRSFGPARIWLGAGLFVLALAVALSWAARQRLDALLARVDAHTLDESGKVLDHLLDQQRQSLSATVGVLSEDTRIRAMVLTPTFDLPTVLDLLTDLKATSGASVVALLDSTGKVRAVVGAPEMDQLDLGTSSLVQGALEKPAAQPWIFGGKVGVLAAAPVRLDEQVLALFMLGFALDDACLERIEQALGASGAVFVGDSMVASASKDPAIERALRAAANLPPGNHRVIEGRYLATHARLGGSALAATVAWIVPLYRQAGDLTLNRAMSWLPAGLTALMLSFMLGLALSQRARPS